MKSPQIKKVVESSKTKRAHLIQVRHRDEVEAPLTDWMQEAYGLQDQINNAKRKINNAKVGKKPIREVCRESEKEAIRAWGSLT